MGLAPDGKTERGHVAHRKKATSLEFDSALFVVMCCRCGRRRMSSSR